MQKILLSIPVYNCENQILRVLESLNNCSNIFHEIILFDNGSSDNTIKNILEYISKNSKKNDEFKLFQNKNNINLGGSHMNIFDYFLNGDFDYLLVIHGDDQGDINDFLNFYSKHKNDDTYKWIKFSRFMKQSKLIGYSKIKTFGNKFFNLIFSIISMKRIHDIGSGLDLYSKKFISSCPYQNFPKDLTFDYYMTLFGVENNSIKFSSQSWKEFDQISNVRIVKQTFNLLKILLNYFLYRININKTFFTKNNNNLSQILRTYKRII